MRNHTTRLLLIVTGLCQLVTYAGCTTASDLEKLRQRLTTDMTMAASKARAERQELRGKLETLEMRTNAAVEGDKRAFDAQTAHTAGLEAKVEQVMVETLRIRKDLEDLTVKRSRDVEAIQSKAGELRQRLSGVEQDLATLNTNSQRLQAQLRNRSSEIQTLTRTLLRNYQLDIEALREHLKALEQEEKDTEPSVRSNRRNIR